MLINYSSFFTLTDYISMYVCVVATAEASASNISIAGFYHTSAWQEHFKEVQKSSLTLFTILLPLLSFFLSFPTLSPSHLLIFLSPHLLIFPFVLA